MTMVEETTEETQPLPESELSETSSWVTGSESTDTVPDGKICEVCNKPIIRQPGQRGRLPRYHPECKATPTRSPKSKSGEGRSKAEREADYLAEKFRESLNKTAVMVGIFDTFDGFAIVSQSKPLSENFRTMMVSFDRLRKPLVEGSGGAGVGGFVFAALAVALPIMAHHGLIPATIGGKPLGEFLEKLPKFLHRLQTEAEKAEAELAARFLEE